MKKVDLQFASGRDVLGSYWGFLSGGGLVIRQDLGVRTGDPVTLNLRIGGRAAQLLDGQVVRANGNTFIRLSPGVSHARLLREALSDSGDAELETALADAAFGLAPI